MITRRPCHHPNAVSRSGSNIVGHRRTWPPQAAFGQPSGDLCSEGLTSVDQAYTPLVGDQKDTVDRVAHSAGEAEPHEREHLIPVDGGDDLVVECSVVDRLLDTDERPCAPALHPALGRRQARGLILGRRNEWFTWQRLKCSMAGGSDYFGSSGDRTDHRGALRVHTRTKRRISEAIIRCSSMPSFHQSRQQLAAVASTSRQWWLRYRCSFLSAIFARNLTIDTKMIRNHASAKFFFNDLCVLQAFSYSP